MIRFKKTNAVNGNSCFEKKMSKYLKAFYLIKKQSFGFKKNKSIKFSKNQNKIFYYYDL